MAVIESGVSAAARAPDELCLDSSAATCDGQACAGGVDVRCERSAGHDGYHVSHLRVRLRSGLVVAYRFDWPSAGVLARAERLAAA